MSMQTEFQLLLVYFVLVKISYSVAVIFCMKCNECLLGQKGNIEFFDVIFCFIQVVTLDQLELNFEQFVKERLFLTLCFITNLSVQFDSIVEIHKLLKGFTVIVHDCDRINFTELLKVFLNLEFPCFFNA